jgi:hypothetical protein
MPRGRILLLVVAAAVLVGVGWNALSDRGPATRIALNDSINSGRNQDSMVIATCPPNATTQRCQLVDEVARLRASHDTGAKWWSMWYHVCLYGALVLASISAYLAKVDVSPKDDSAAAKAIAVQQTDRRRTWAAILTLAAALLTSLSAAGGFGEKWKANRDARARFDAVRIDLQDPWVTLGQVRDSIRAIIRDENAAINAAGAK